MKLKVRRKTKINNQPSYSEKTATLLPAKISGIQTQKKNKNRFSVFIEDEFLIGISDSVLTGFKLSKGVEITPFLLDRIVKAEEQQAAKEYMFRILGRRDHSKKELKTKAIKKGFTASHLDDLISELEDKGYLNDHSFAEKYVSDKYEFNNWGPYKIRSALFKKGIDKRTAENALNRVFDEQEILSTLKELVLKKKRRFLREPEEKRKKKIFDFLIRKGYDSNHIWKMMDDLLELIDK